MTPHPDPPPDLAARALPISRRTRRWFRVHPSTKDPLYFGRRRLHRFDSPTGTYGVLYAGIDEHCAFIETFGHATGTRLVSEAELRARGLALIAPARPLRLVDLTGPGLARLGADARLTSGDDLEVSRRWSQALHDHPAAPDGILYRARHDPGRLAVAFYERVAADLSSPMTQGLLEPAWEARLARILDDYDFGLIP